MITEMARTHQQYFLTLPVYRNLWNLLLDEEESAPFWVEFVPPEQH